MANNAKSSDASFMDSASPGLKSLLAHHDAIFALGVMVVLASLLIPLPTFFMDLLLSCSIAVSVSTLVIILSARESIEFSTFPSLLLLVTLFRLALNVASTRLVLLQGDAGAIISTFGNFVVQGNLVIGLVIFLILVIIQFVVITKGAERISEVAARFHLDAMPGKQMAIDADLNAGLIGEDEARLRRQNIVKESEFYGAMDGASKFIRGDAVAGLVITAINLVGGFLVGMAGGLTMAQSVQKYSILAIGDGLVTQIPAVITATASGFLISKTSTQHSLSQDLLRQFLSRSRPLGVVAFLLGAMVLVPGFPKTPFIVLALSTGIVARMLSRGEKQAAARPAQRPAGEDEAPVEELLDVDRVCVQVGPRLIRTVDPRKKSSLSHRINPLRKKFVQQYGLVLPLVRLRDSMTLSPDRYEIRLHNHVVGSGNLEPEKLLAMDPGTVRTPLEGQKVLEPVFNLPALWINADQKPEAELGGYTVVDPETILVTHLSETLRKHAHELLSRDDVQKLVDRLRGKQPSLVNGVIGDLVPVGLLQRVLANLLRDGIAIRDLAQIIETLGDHAGRTKDPNLLTEAVRKSLVRTITEQNATAEGRIQAIVLDPASEYALRSSLAREGDSQALSLPPDRALDLCRKVSEAWRTAMDKGQDKAVMLCDYRLRPQVAALLARAVPQLPVLAYDEIAIGTQIDSLAAIKVEAPEPALMPAGRA
jgi:flagellar biosynthesis protein FlhA